MRKYLALLTALLILFAAPPAQAADSNYYQLLINKQYMLGESYQPQNLVNLDQYIDAGAGVKLTEQAAVALQQMIQTMQAAGISDVYGLSGYRSYDTQRSLYNNKTAAYRNQGYGGEEARRLAGMVVAPPGTSEHQSGMAIDLASTENDRGLTESFADTQAGQWLAANCWQYGYILRYPADKVALTGYIYEPWHFRYVGQPHAEYMAQHNLCLEEYIALLREQRLLTFTAADGVTYAVYYNEYNNSDRLPGEILGVSAAYAAAGGCVITARPPEQALFDLVGHWSESEVRALYALGVADSYDDNTFRPDNNINRAELMMLINNVYQLLFGANQTAVSGDPEPTGDADAQQELPQPVDVAPAVYYYQALVNNRAHQLVPEEMLTWREGRLYFDPENDVLRREAAKALSPLFAALPEIPFSGIILKDMLAADEELRQAVQLLVDYGVIQGDSQGNFNPDAYISRGELCVMLNRIVSYFHAAAAANAEPTAEQPASADLLPKAAEGGEG